MKRGIKKSKVLSLYSDGKREELYEYAGSDLFGFVEEYLLDCCRFDVLCDKYSIGVSTAYQYMKELGVYSRRTGRNQNKIDKSIVKLLNDEEYLRSRIENETIVSIARDLGVHTDTLVVYAKKFGIRTNLHAEFRKNGNVDTLKYLTYDYLYEQYINNRKCAQKIASEIGTTQNTVLSYLKKFGISRRSGIELACNGKNGNFIRMYDKKFIYEQYVELGKTAGQIGAEIGSTDCSVLRRLKEFGIKSRSTQEYINSTSSIHRNVLIPLLEKEKVNHVSNYIIRMSETKNWAYEIDEYLPDLKVFLELQGIYWHGFGNLDERVLKNVYRDIKKWRNLTRVFPYHRIVYILESDFEDGLAEKIVQGLANKDRRTPVWSSEGYSFQLAGVHEVSEFVKQHHYLGNVPSSKYIFVAKHQNQIVAVAVFSSPSRHEQRIKYGDEMIELSRYCSSEHGTNLNSWFLSRCIRSIKERPIVSYADITRYPGKLSHDGTMYKAANFKLVGVTDTNYRYLTPDHQLIHKKAVWNRAKKNGVSEKSQARNEGLVKFPEWPKRIYVLG